MSLLAFRKILSSLYRKYGNKLVTVDGKYLQSKSSFTDSDGNIHLIGIQKSSCTSPVFVQELLLELSKYDNMSLILFDNCRNEKIYLNDYRR